MKKKLINRIAKKLVEEKKKEYTRLSHRSRWTFTTLSATIGNFREAEENKSHTPLSIFYLNFF